MDRLNGILSVPSEVSNDMSPPQLFLLTDLPIIAVQATEDVFVRYAHVDVHLDSWAGD